MIAAVIFPVTPADMIGNVLACVRINIAGKYPLLLATRAGVPSGFAFVGLQNWV
nr:hypothetical protein [Pontibacter ummariensis]